MPRRELRDARIIVTGASSGIGAALAEALAARGAKLVVTARREPLLQQLAAKIQSAGGTVEYVAGDVTDEAVRRAVIDRTISKFGGLDVLVNNAGVGAFGRFDEADPARLRQLFEVDFFAALELTRLALPTLKQGSRPAIVNVGSILGRRALPLATEYCAAKFALRGFSEALRMELVQSGVDVLLVSPGTTDTGFFANVLEMKAKLPWRKEGARQGMTPEATAAAIVVALEKGRNEVIPGVGPKLLALAERFVPGLVDRVMRRYL
jgi:short-subunit dehydrogenase